VSGNDEVFAHVFPSIVVLTRRAFTQGLQNYRAPRDSRVAGCVKPNW
jgi:hypothetical protein